MSYRSRFKESSAAEAYQDLYDGGDLYAGVLWAFERELLAELSADLRNQLGRIEYLDFAAGTGRIVTFMAEHVDAATGIEISPSMLEIARGRAQKATLICRDITEENAEIEGKYDLITAFRFFLNAESGLRRAAMRALASRLRDERSLLVFNNHGNPWSHKAVAYPYYAARAALDSGFSAQNYMTDRDVRTLVADAGLRMVKSVGYGLVSSKLSRLMGFERAYRAERLLARTPASAFGVSRLYVVARAP